MLRRSPNRSKPYRRLTSHVRVGRAAQRRIRAGGVLAKGRPSLDRLAYKRLKIVVAIRANGRCEFCNAPDGPYDLEHALPRSRGGGDTFSGCWFACRPCHRKKEAPYETGRLLVTPLGRGDFMFEMVRGSKAHHYTVCMSRIEYRLTDDDLSRIEAQISGEEAMPC